MNTEIQEVQLNTYPAYKDSGVEWLGVIPEHWEVKRFKHVFFEKKKITNTNLSCGSISFGQVVYKNDEKVPIATKQSYQVLEKGEFLINPLNLNYDLISLRIALSDKDVVVSSGYIIVNNSIKINRDYYKWLLHIFDITYMKTLGSGVRQTLSFAHIANSELAFPPLSEQTAIANFLDDKCAKIDAAVEIKQQQIELLKERRQIAIHQAVTQGLDPSVPMKDSGVEWIGEIPEHWSVKRLKNFIINLESGVSVNGSESQSASKTEIGVLKTSCVYNYVFEPEQNKKVEKVDLNRVSCPVIKDRIIISRMNAPELVGASGLVKESFPNLFLPDRLWQTVFNADEKFDTFWLSQVLVSKGFRRCITAIATGSSPSMKNITKGDFLNLNLAHPPFQEQKKIAKFIEELTTKIDTTISLYEQEIEKLKEYKTVLINSAVTGKIMVNC